MVIKGNPLISLEIKFSKRGPLIVNVLLFANCLFGTS